MPRFPGALPKPLLDERFGFRLPESFARFLELLTVLGGDDPAQALAGVGLRFSPTPLDVPVPDLDSYYRFPGMPCELRLFAWALSDGGCYGFLVDDPEHPPEEPIVVRYWPLEFHGELLACDFPGFLSAFTEECAGLLDPPHEADYETRVLHQGGARVLFSSDQAAPTIDEAEDADDSPSRRAGLTEFERAGDSLLCDNASWRLLQELLDAFNLPDHAPDLREHRARAVDRRRAERSAATADGLGLVTPRDGLESDLVLLPWRTLGGWFEQFFRRAELALEDERPSSALVIARNLQILSGIEGGARLYENLIDSTRLLEEAYARLGREAYAREASLMASWIAKRRPRER